MKFYEALKLLDEGRKIRKIAWGKERFIHKKNGGFYCDKGEQLAAVDITWFGDFEWQEFLKETPCTYKTAINAFLEGRKLEILLG